MIWGISGFDFFFFFMVILQALLYYGGVHINEKKKS